MPAFLSFRAPILALLLAVLANPLAAQPVTPTPPEKYRVKLRYRILAPRDEHVTLYDALIEHLKSLEFEFIPPLDRHPNTDREDPRKNYLEGLVAPANALKILRDANVAALHLAPADFKLPEDHDQPVRVRLELASGFKPATQLELANQVRMLLLPFGFREAVGYDHRGHSGRPFSRLAGAIPAAHVDTLLKDLRRQPGDWFSSVMEQTELPQPVRSVSPIRIIEIAADPEPLQEAPFPAPRGAEYLEKISADLWTLVSAKDQQERVFRVELILPYTPGEGETVWRRNLREGAPDVFVEGRLGQFVTCLARPEQVRRLAALPVVSALRLARPVRARVDPAIQVKADDAQALKKSGLADLHQKGFRGKGTRLAILDADFRGHEDMVKSKLLPPGTRLVDLTSERNHDIQPDAYPADGRTVGHGTHCALAAALAAPEADITLIRIDATSAFQVQQVAQYIRGTLHSEHLDHRQDELLATRAFIRAQRVALLKEREKILANFDDDLDLERDYDFLGPVRGWIFDERLWHRQRMAYQEKEELELRQREDRFLKLHADIRSLQGIPIVATALNWSDGYPLGGASPLSRWFADSTSSLPTEGRGVRGSGSRKAPAELLWFQAAGNTRGQSWNGMFRDADGNSVMEFAPPGSSLPKGRWTSELNFLAWQPYEGAASPELPGKVRLRVSLQWREPHDPAYAVRAGEPDYYQYPLAGLQMVLLRQRDPDAKGLPTDDLEVVARSWGMPQRLENHPGSSVYEQVLEVTVDKAARHALRVERQPSSQWILKGQPDRGRLVLSQLTGLTPTGVRPQGVVTLPDLEKSWELRPRLFADAVDDTLALQGRPVFVDFPTDQGDIGVPADSRGVITIGAVDPGDRPHPAGALGPPANLEWVRKPTVSTYAAFQLGNTSGGAYGTSLATPFAAGWTAVMLSAGNSPAQLRQFLQQQNGAVLRLPGKK